VAYPTRFRTSGALRLGEKKKKKRMGWSKRRVRVFPKKRETGLCGSDIQLHKGKRSTRRRTSVSSVALQRQKKHRTQVEADFEWKKKGLACSTHYEKKKGVVGVRLLSPLGRKKRKVAGLTPQGKRNPGQIFLFSLILPSLGEKTAR